MSMLVLFAVAGCQSVAPAREAALPDIPDPLPRVTPQHRLPLDAYRIEGPAARRFEDDFNKLVEQCASVFGVALTLVSERPALNPQDSRMWPGTLGLMSLNHARKFGYHAEPGQASTEPIDVFVNEAQPRISTVLNGPDRNSGPILKEVVPAGGCRGRVSDDLGGDPSTLEPEAVRQVRVRAVRDQRVSRAMVAWSDCMWRRGYDFDRVDEPADLALGAKPSRAEREVAVADVTCTRESRWYDTLHAVEHVMQQRVVDESRGELAAHLEQTIALVQRASRAASE